ncbi:MAG: peptide chain release factor aRF-1 [archaeon]
MALEGQIKNKLKRFVRKLELIRGRHTELVSVYIPSGYDMNKIINHLQQEQGTAVNIKDKTTRQSVIDSLERMIRNLKLFKATPPNGLAIFSGNISEREGKSDIQVWSMEPPEPLKTRMYRCDQIFITEPLKEFIEYKEVYGLIVMDKREATVGLLKGSNITVLHKRTSAVPGKTKAGGQSAARFSRIREGAAKEFFNRIAEVVNKEFLPMNNLKGIIIGGPGPTKETFFKGNFLNNNIKLKILALQDIGYTDEYGLHDLVDKSRDILAQEVVIQEKKIMEKFFTILAKDEKKAAYGKAEIEKVLELRAVETLLLSEAIDDNTIEEFEAKCEESGAELQVISTDTREGAQLRDMGGYAAILRFQVY